MTSRGFSITFGATLVNLHSNYMEEPIKYVDAASDLLALSLGNNDRGITASSDNATTITTPSATKAKEEAEPQNRSRREDSL